MSASSRRILRDRFIRGAIIATQRGDTSHAAYAMSLAIQHTRALVVETSRKELAEGVT